MRGSDLGREPPLRRFEPIWYGYNFLRELVLIYPVSAIMMGDAGVDPFELSLLLALWSLSVAVLEVPSGTLADRMSRRTLLGASLGIKSGCFVLWWALPTFGGFLAGFLLWGTASALRSGTAESFLYDTLRWSGRTSEFEKILGREKAASNLGVALALLGGGFLARDGYGVPLFLSTGASLVALPMVLMLSEPPRGASARSSTYRATMLAGLDEARRSPRIRGLILIFAIVVVVYGVVEEYTGPLLDELGFSLPWIGILYASAQGARGVGAVLAHRLPIHSVRAGLRLIVAGSLVFAGGIGVGHPPLALAVVVVCLYFAMTAAGEILVEGQLQRAIRGEARATITSLARLGLEATSLGYYLLAGIFAAHLGFAAATALLAGLAILFAAWFDLAARMP